MGTKPTQSEYQVRLVPPTGGDWAALSNPRKDSVIQQRLAHELGTMQAIRAFLTKSDAGSCCIAENGFFEDEIILKPSNVPLCINTRRGADAIWLGRRQAFLDLVNSRLLYLVRGRDFYLAGRYTNRAVELILAAFNTRNVDPSEMTILACFAGPGKQQQQLERFAERCGRAGVKRFESRYSIPKDGPYPYATHSDPSFKRLHNLGILMRS